MIWLPTGFGPGCDRATGRIPGCIIVGAADSGRQRNNFGGGYGVAGTGEEEWLKGILPPFPTPSSRFALEPTTVTGYNTILLRFCLFLSVLA